MFAFLVFVDMFQYPKLAIVKRDGKGTNLRCTIYRKHFEDDDQKKLFRYLSFSTFLVVNYFFARKVILVEGDTEKQIIPYWASKLLENDKNTIFPQPIYA